MKYVKLMLYSFLFILFLNISQFAQAAEIEGMVENKNNSGYFEINYNQELDSVAEETIVKISDLKVDGEKELAVLDDGSVLSVEVTEQKSSMQRATKAYKTFQYTTTNINGVKKNAFKVSITVTYTPSKTTPSYVLGTITQMSGTYTIQDTSFKCRWDNSEASKSQNYHEIILKAETTLNYYETWFCSLLSHEGIDIYDIQM